MSFCVQGIHLLYGNRSIFSARGALSLLHANAETALLLIEQLGRVLMIDKTGRIVWWLSHPFAPDACFIHAANTEGAWYVYREDGVRFEFDPLTGCVDPASARHLG